MYKNKYKKDIEISKINNFESLLYEIQSADAIISPRMHGLILAKVYNKEVYPYILSDKISSFVDHYLTDQYDKEIICNRIISDLKSCLKQ